MRTVTLSALDTYFFRDGRPYNQDDPGQAEAASLFPPHPPTVVGAIRAALARARGWPAQEWPADRLGDGVDWQKGDQCLGPLRFTGPYLSQGEEMLFPAPLCLVRATGDDDAQVIDRLTPGSELPSDLGAARLPEAPNREGFTGWKVLEDHWVDRAGMTKVLNGQAPKSVLPATDLWQSEPRVGIERGKETHTTARFAAENGKPERGALYAAAHIRPWPELSLVMTIDGLDEPPPDPCLAPVGGESRSAWLAFRDQAFDYPRADWSLETGDTIRYTIIHITPADLGDGAWPRPGETLRRSDGSDAPGTVVSACLGRAIRVGGWDGAARKPLPLRPLIPPGSVWFMETRSDDADAVKALNGQAIGRSTAWGFGQVLVGRWSPRGGDA